MQESKDTSVKKSKFALEEEKTLDFWRQNDIFKKSLEKPAPAGDFIFYEGPPTANGKPGIHHLEARAFKDAIPRYKTMRGFRVRRKGGWDTHGLPVELQVEKELGLRSKKEIENYGIEAFNAKCKESVWKYADEWKRFTDRMGYWVDLRKPYVTYDPAYIEALWAVVKRAHDRQLLYKDYKVVPWCPRCGTALSSHELAQGYQDVKDLSVYVKFKLLPGQKVGKTETSDNTYVLAWTTTPWTLPGNVALAVGEKIKYIKVKAGKDILILAKDRLSVLKDAEHEIVEEFPGSRLVGGTYEPLYPFLKENFPYYNIEKAYKVYAADFVTTTDGTGIVHTAVMYGADDFELGTKIGLPKYHLVNDDGTFKQETGFLAGKFVKDEATAVDIIKDLAHRSLLFKKEKYEHSYPHCWRCKTPLIYFARDSWYIRMSALRKELVAANEDINWEPAHMKEGRFGEWLREIKDWAISRERYWGTPLPIWTCDACAEISVVGAFDEIRRVVHSNNRYLVMRHGEAENNTLGIVSCDANNGHHLTEFGKEQVTKAVIALKERNIDFIYLSPYARTKETAAILATILDLKPEQIIEDERLGEVRSGVLNNRPIGEYRAFFKTPESKFTTHPEGGETHNDIKGRMTAMVADLEKKHSGKTILILSHETPLWLLCAGAKGLGVAETIALRGTSDDFIKNAEVRELVFEKIPRDKNGEFDPHRPFIDDVAFPCACKKGTMRRVKEVMDVWFDSGAMPFAQFAADRKGETFEAFWKAIPYPADFIAEAIDQTRGWFYTLHAVGAIMERGKAYRNVISLGHILDAEGKKMSKSIGNIVEPWSQMDKYGVDTLRFWMYSVNQPGDSKNYDERTVDEITKKVFNLLSNVETFYSLHKEDADHESQDPYKSPHMLDRWILALKDELVSTVTARLDAYDLFEPTRALRDFIADLSQWYIRRSRDRFKDKNTDTAYALATTRHVLVELSKLLAPFTPFYAETLYLKLAGGKESVHLEDWPNAKSKVEGENANIVEEMKEVRAIVSLGLEARARVGIKVRQPLQKLKIKALRLKGEEALTELVKDEVNVKEIVFESELPGSVELDVKITPELKEEGLARELIRFIQDMRKKKGLNPSDRVTLLVDTDENGKGLVLKFEKEIAKVAGLKVVEFKALETADFLETDDVTFKLALA